MSCLFSTPGCLHYTIVVGCLLETSGALGKKNSGLEDLLFSSWHHVCSGLVFSFSKWDKLGIFSWVIESNMWNSYYSLLLACSFFFTFQKEAAISSTYFHCHKRRIVLTAYEAQLPRETKMCGNHSYQRTQANGELS